MFEVCIYPGVKSRVIIHLSGSRAWYPQQESEMIFSKKYFSNVLDRIKNVFACPIIDGTWYMAYQVKVIEIYSVIIAIFNVGHIFSKYFSCNFTKMPIFLLLEVLPFILI